MTDIKSLYESRAEAWSKANDIRERSERESRDLTTDEDQTFTRALDDVEAIDNKIRNEERAQALSNAGDNGGTTPPEAMQVAADDGDEGRSYEEAFSAMLRRGVGDVSYEDRQALQQNYAEVRAQGTGSPGTAGGYAVPEGFLNKMTETMKSYGGLLSIVNVINTSTGQDLPWPTSDDSGNKGVIVDENPANAIGEQDVTLGQRKLGAYMYTSKQVRVSYQLLQDSAFNLDTWLPGILGARIGRAVAEHIAVGTGSGQPEGVSKATVGKTGEVSGTAKIAYTDLIELEHSLDSAYRPRAQYAFSDKSLAMVRSLVDQDDRPLWVPSLQEGIASTINGYRYVVDNDLPTPAAKGVSVFFGDFNAGYTARNVSGAQVLRLTERYADYLQVGFLGFSRWDGLLDDKSAIVAFKHGATA